MRFFEGSWSFARWSVRTQSGLCENTLNTLR